jgi:hypothetical protein
MRNMKIENETIEMKRKLSQLHDYQEEVISAMEEYWDAWYPSPMPLSEHQRNNGDDDKNGMNRLYQDLLWCNDDRHNHNDSNNEDHYFSKDDWKAIIQCCNDSYRVNSTVDQSFTQLEESIYALERTPGFSRINYVAMKQQQRFQKPNKNQRGKVKDIDIVNGGTRKPDFSRKTKWKTWKQALEFRHPTTTGKKMAGATSPLDTVHSTEEIYRKLCSIFQDIVWLTAAEVTESPEETDDEALSNATPLEAMSHSEDDDNENEDDSYNQEEEQEHLDHRQQQQQQQPGQKLKQCYSPQHAKAIKHVTFAQDCKQDDGGQGEGDDRILAVRRVVHVSRSKTKNKINLRQKWQGTSSRVLATILPFWARFRKERSYLVSHSARALFVASRTNKNKDKTDENKNSSNNNNNNNNNMQLLGSLWSKPCNSDWTGWYQSSMYCR